MKKIEYKFVTFPLYSLRPFMFRKEHASRMDELNKTFNSLGKDGWELVDIYWSEALDLFKREIADS